ncbi:MAG: serine peptidase [Rhodobacterales bacterium 65-51]|uniref:S49 family peptidase n=1 Tax=uncultured Gemmobacter sp. TaxID=1095917 RepID=UPI00095DAA41|nr:S49 family peptidase [uncultured Gemmobacter sp.]OJY29309.1 MAG: serine peptidase [Rhodobacterales bacterium 65-51]
MHNDLTAIIAAIRAQPWAIMPEYLEAIEAVAARALDADVLARIAGDSHHRTIGASWSALAAVGMPLDGATSATQRDGAAIIPMLGPIFPRSSMISASSDGTSLSTMMRDLRVANASEQIDRIVMLVDSPGGVVSGLGEAADEIAASRKPVTAFVTGMCASAAYWLSSQAREIVMDRSAYAGSLGVVATVTRQEAVGQDGRRAYEIVSSGAPLKRADPSTEEGRAALQADVDAAEAVFFADVARGRRVSLETISSDFGQGGMLAAERAVRVGMADRIGTLEGVLSQVSGRTRSNTGGRRALAAAELETRRRAADRS